MTITTFLPRQIRFEGQLAWRHLRSGGGQTWLTIAAVASGVIIVIFIMGLIFGLQRKFTALLTDAIPHVTVQVPEGKPIPYADLPGSRPGPTSSRSEMQAPQRKNIDDWRTVLSIADTIPNVRTVSPAVAGQGFASKGANPVGVSLTGADPAQQELITPVTRNLIAGHYIGLAADEVVIDYELAKDLNVGVGDRIRITSISGIPEPPRIAGIYSKGQGRGSAYVTLRTGQSMLGIGNSVNVVYVKVYDIYGADAVAERLAVLLDCEAKSWSSEFPNFVTSLQAQAASAYLISGFTLIASSFAIASVLIVSVQRKAKQIGILKSIGARKNQILLVFLLEGLGIAVAGSVMGAIAGIAVVYLLSLPKQAVTRVGGVPESLFPLMLDPLYILAAMGAATLATLLAALLPARSAAKMNPVDAMR
ncbi:MAG: ABC transporter permease [Acidobacteria bacterium]|nr:ABC transporter permease [Acidobacteriota bacterium]